MGLRDDFRTSRREKLRLAEMACASSDQGPENDLAKLYTCMERSSLI
jgi:hypothetical protein